MISYLLFFLMAVQSQSAQHYTMPVKTKASGHQYAQEAFPAGIMLYTLEGKAVELKIDSPTLIQIWSVCCGGDAMLWADQRFTENQYAPKGLRVVSINFENGKDYKQQNKAMATFFETMPKPEEIYMDHLGYVFDNLHASGTPYYILVNKDGTIVFRSSGRDKEGISLLDSEIQNLLEQ